MSLIRGDAITIPLADNTVDLIVTSPPYFALRSYTDACGTCGGIAATNGTPITGGTERSTLAGKGPQHYQTEAVEPDPDCPECQGSGRGHYAGQLGSEATPAAFIDALIAVTAECVRVLKPSGSLFVNLGDKYAGSGGHNNDGISSSSTLSGNGHKGGVGKAGTTKIKSTRRSAPDRYNQNSDGIRAKSLMGLPWRYALACIDQLGLILRAEIIWNKPNGLPESVQDRVRRSHEQWFHFTLEPRYYSAVDEIREAYAPVSVRRMAAGFDGNTGFTSMAGRSDGTGANGEGSGGAVDPNPLGKLPGSVWTVPTEPLRVPDDLPQHFAAFPSEWPRRIILGWSPSGICCECGQGRRPVTETNLTFTQANHSRPKQGPGYKSGHLGVPGYNETTITGESCACPTPTAPTRPAVVLDPFAGTGTTVAVANHLGRYGVGIDLSNDYLKLARWRLNDPGLRAKALGVDKPKPQIDGQESLFPAA